MAAKGCISLYEVGGKSYFWFPTWGKHQRIRDVKPKYPSPIDEKPICGNLRQAAADCGGLPPETKTKPKPDRTKEPQPKDEDEIERLARSESVFVVVERVVGRLRSAKARHELDCFLDDMGEDCVLRALDVAVEAGQPKWPYVRGILVKKRDRGVRSAEEWDQDEEKHQTAKDTGKRAIAGMPRDVQPSPERAKENSDWLEEFLKGQEGKSC